jgi:hypothetical protein
MAWARGATGAVRLQVQASVGAAVLLVGVAVAFSPLLAVGALVAVVGGVALMLSPTFGAVIAVAVVPASSGLARGLPVPGLRVSEVLTAATAAGTFVLLRPGVPRWRMVDWLAGLYVLITAVLGLLGCLTHDITMTPTVLGTLTGPLQFLLLYRSVVANATTRAIRTLALRWALTISIPVGTLAIAQRFSGAVQEFLGRLTDSTAYRDNIVYSVARVTGPFPHWHVLGGYLLVVVLLAVALLADSRQEVLPPRLLLPILGLALVAALLTLTAAVLGGAAVGAVIVAVTGPRRRKVLTVIGAVILTGALAGSPLLASRVADQRNRPGSSHTLLPETLNYRYDIWIHQYAPVLKGRLLFGYGPTIPPEVTWKYTESLYVSMLLRGGIPLLLAQLALFAAAWAACRRIYRDPESEPSRAAAARVVAATTVVLVPMHALFPYFITTGLPHLWWALLGVALAGEIETGDRLRPRRLRLQL